MIRRIFMKTLGAAGAGAAGIGTAFSSSNTRIAGNDRIFWLNHLDKLARPVLENLANNTLRANMPVEGKLEDRPQVTHLEAFARLLAGIAPWLNNEHITDKNETRLQENYLKLCVSAVDNATNPSAKDYMNYTRGHQPLVDTAFFAHGLIRAPRLWNALPAKVKENVINALRSTRSIRPGFNNWLLFSAMIEAFFAKFGYEYDKMRIDYALRQHDQWYKGDGMYGDGPDFHYDYYNSYVIQPFLFDILQIIAPKEGYKELTTTVTKRAIRYADIQERLINSDGTFPVVGRSICYRAGAFQHLANMALNEKLPELVTPEQVRCGLTAVIKKTMENPGTFDEKGWLRIGLYGHQFQLGDYYISTGSLYLCSEVLLPLGLPESHRFWSGPEAPWTAKKVWSGIDIPADHAY